MLNSIKKNNLNYDKKKHKEKFFLKIEEMISDLAPKRK
jgi:hypothetical protein